MGIKAHSLGSLGLALVTGKPLVTPLWLQELLPKARLVPPALSFLLSTRQVRAEPVCASPPYRSRVAKCCSSSASPWALTILGYFIVHDPHLWLAGKSCLMLSCAGPRATKTQTPHHPSPRRQSSTANSTRWLPGHSPCQILRTCILQMAAPQG